MEFEGTGVESDKKLIVFDLDYTLWPLHVDECSPPFTKNNLNNSITDSKGIQCRLYSEIPDILKFLKKENYTLAVASRAKNISGSYQLLHLFDIANYFTYKEIYSGSKKQHFSMLWAKSKTNFQNMVFFDNDRRNITDVIDFGVQCFLVTEEITLQFVCARLHLTFQT